MQQKAKIVQPPSGDHYCEAAWSIARKFIKHDPTQMKILAAAIHGAVLNENRRCVNWVRDTERLAGGMGVSENPAGEMINPTQEMCKSIAEGLETSFAYK